MNQDIIDVVESYFKAGINKDIAKLYDIQLNDTRFNTFSDVPPFDLQNYEQSVLLEELRFASISDYNFEIIEPSTSIWGDVAVVAFILKQTGMLVDNKTYTGRYIDVKNRATFVLVKKDTWKIVHIHMSNMV